jgi:hypothetical protein
MPSPFDPLAWLRSKGAEAHIVAGEIQLRFDQSIRREDRERIRRVIERRYLGLLRLQLDVPAGVRPRTVQQLMASGRIRVVEGKYMIATGATK